MERINLPKTTSPQQQSILLPNVDHRGKNPSTHETIVISAGSASTCAYLDSKSRQIPTFALPGNSVDTDTNACVVEGHSSNVSSIPNTLQRKPLVIRTLQLPAKDPNAVDDNNVCTLKRHLGGLPFPDKIDRPTVHTIPALQLQDVIDRKNESEECMRSRDHGIDTVVADEACVTFRYIEINDTLSARDYSSIVKINEGNMPEKPIAQGPSGKVPAPMIGTGVVVDAATELGSNKDYEVLELTQEDLEIIKKQKNHILQKKSRPSIPPIFLLQGEYSPLHKGNVESLAYIVHAHEAFKADAHNEVTIKMMDAITNHLENGNYMENYDRCSKKFAEESKATSNDDVELEFVRVAARMWFKKQFSNPM